MDTNTPSPLRLRLALPHFIAVGLNVAAVSALLTATARSLLGSFGDWSTSAVAASLLLFALPVILVAPLMALLTRGASARWTRLLSTLVLLSVLGWSMGEVSPVWLSVAGIGVFVLAVYLMTAMAVLYSTARATSFPSVRLTALFAFMVGIGVLDGWKLAMEAASEKSFLVKAFACVCVAFVCEFFARTASVPMGEGSLWRRILSGLKDSVRHRNARNCLIGLWVWFFVAATVLVALVRLQRDGDGQPIWLVEAGTASPLDVLATESTWTWLIALLSGIVVSAIGKNSFRSAFVLPYAAGGSFVCVLWWLSGNAWLAPLVGVGFCLGVSFTPLLHYFLVWTTPRHHGIGAGVVVASGCIAVILLALCVNSTASPVELHNRLLDLLLAVTLFVAIGSWIVFLRPAIEGTLEVLLWPVYRIKGYGMGIPELPDRGPCLVIANHSAWWDPLWLAKILPPPTTPMMTSKFYDLPVVSWLMRRVMMTIRVPDKPYRHEAPELNEAVAALNRGDCIVLFPEGYLRRKEEVPLRRFGRGVWHILAQRPSTPVYACWIEGNWGSYFSFKNGPPTKNKRIDFWYPIKVSVVGPIVVPTATLADHMATRLFLMQQVSLAREQLGLLPVEIGQVTEGDAE